MFLQAVFMDRMELSVEVAVLFIQETLNCFPMLQSQYSN